MSGMRKDAVLPAFDPNATAPRVELSIQAINWDIYGAIVRSERIKLGYRKAEDFAKSIWRRARCSISRDALYKIEQGKQVPSTEQFMALNLIFFGELFPTNNRLLKACFCDEWISIDETAVFPQTWQEQNLLEAYNEVGFLSDDRRRCMFESDLPDNDEVYLDADSYLASDKVFTVTKTIDENNVITGEVYAIANGYCFCY